MSIQAMDLNQLKYLWRDSGCPEPRREWFALRNLPFPFSPEEDSQIEASYQIRQQTQNSARGVQEQDSGLLAEIQSLKKEKTEL